jgi:hypothetical protein
MDERITLLDNPIVSVSGQLLKDFPDYDFLPIKTLIVSMDGDMLLRSKENPDVVSLMIKDVGYVVSNGLKLDYTPEIERAGVEKFVFNSPAVSNVISAFLNPNNYIDNLVTQYNIDTQKIDSLKSVLLVYNPLSMINIPAEDNCLHYYIHVPENAKLRNKLIMKAYVNNNPFVKPEPRKGDSPF